MRGDIASTISFQPYRSKYFLLNKSICDGKIIVRDAQDENAHSVILDKTGKKLFEIKKAKERMYSYPYMDGYLIFDNGEGKFGVVDNKGEIVIRAKYNALDNAGDGEFFAIKGDKAGVINAKDEIILDFDYDYGLAKMGDNFLMRDGGDISLVGRDGKEITSFHEACTNADSYVEFVDVEGITNQLIKTIEEFEKPMSAKKIAQDNSLSVDDYHYKSNLGNRIVVDEKAFFDITIYFDGQITEETFHQEEVNDGWFTYNRTVSDGWQWTDNIPRKTLGTLSFKDLGIGTEVIFNELCRRLASNHKKISDCVYSKNIKVENMTLECRTKLEKDEDTINLEIQFRE